MGLWEAKVVFIIKYSDYIQYMFMFSGHKHRINLKTKYELSGEDFWSTVIRINSK